MLKMGVIHITWCREWTPLRGEPEKEPGLLQNKLILIHIYDA